MKSFKKEQLSSILGYLKNTPRDMWSREGVEGALKIIARKRGYKHELNEHDISALMCSGIAEHDWNLCGRNTYVFNESMSEELFGDLADTEYARLLKVLKVACETAPYPAFMVEYTYGGHSCEGLISFMLDGFCYISHEPSADDDTTKGVSGHVVYDDDNVWSCTSSYDVDESAGEDFLIATRLFILASYVCAENADIFKIPLANRKGAKVKGHKLGIKPVQRFDVGFRIGPKLSAARTVSTPNPSTKGTGTKKRPHMRKGHMHTVRYKNERKEWCSKIIYYDWTMVNGGDTNTTVIHKTN